jgi:hypothetical protein
VFVLGAHAILERTHNTILLGEALRIPVGLLLGQREQLFERV